MVDDYDETIKKPPNSNPDQEDDAKAKLERGMNSLKSLYRRSRKTFPKNILLVGQPSAGKSSFTNLLRATFAGNYDEIAKPGSISSGLADAATRQLLFYENMGLTDEEVEEFRKTNGLDDDEYEDFQLPTIVDMPGMSGYHESRKDILKYVFDGAIPHKTEISCVYNDKKAIQKFDFDEKNMKRRRIDRVIFVVSVLQDIQEQMFKDVVELIEPNGVQTSKIPYIVVFTHVDCDEVKVEKKQDAAETSYQRRKEIVTDIMKISDNKKLNTHDVINYSDQDELDEFETYLYKTDLNKHAKAIEALNKLVRQREEIDEKPTVNQNTVWFDATKKKGRMVASILSNNRSIIVPVLIIIFIAVFIELVLQRTGTQRSELVNIVFIKLKTLFAQFFSIFMKKPPEAPAPAPVTPSKPT